ncbi:MAG: hypothetical protein RL748_2874 [Pseudomonadota bacterium]
MSIDTYQQNSGLKPFERNACDFILGAAISDINTITAARSFTMDSFREFTRPLNQAIQLCMSQAARQQVDTMGAVVDGLPSLRRRPWTLVSPASRPLI